MIWIFVAVGLGMFLVPPQFRKIALAALGVVLLIFLVTVLVNRRPAPDLHGSTAAQKITTPAGSRRFDFDAYERDKKDKEDPDAKARILPAEIRFDQVGLNSGIDSGTIQAVRARLYNDSPKFALTDYAYYLRVQDCLPDIPCTTVFDQRGWLSLTVPPGQARDVVIAIARNSTSSAAPFKLLGKARVELTPDQVRAYSAAAPTP